MNEVVHLPPRDIETLRERLQAEGFTFEERPHAHYLSRGPDVTVTAYRSGKVLITGAGARRLASTLRGGDAEARQPPADAFPRLGTDESGKGDFFGPLVVAGVVVEDKAAEGLLARAGVMDSKKVSDAQVPELARRVRNAPHAVVRLDPATYNERWRRSRNVNVLLTEVHAEVIEALSGTNDRSAVVVDAFDSGERLRRRLGPAVASRLDVRPRAESDVAVAAASILARNAFLEGLRELGEEAGLKLPKGAGLHVKRLARRLEGDLGTEGLARLGKTHFRWRR